MFCLFNLFLFILVFDSFDLLMDGLMFWEGFLCVFNVVIGLAPSGAAPSGECRAGKKNEENMGKKYGEKPKTERKHNGQKIHWENKFFISC